MYDLYTKGIKRLLIINKFTVSIFILISSSFYCICPMYLIITG